MGFTRIFYFEVCLMTSSTRGIKYYPKGREFSTPDRQYPLDRFNYFPANWKVANCPVRVVPSAPSEVLSINIRCGENMGY